MTPHPLATCTTPLTLSAEPGNGLPVDYVACTDPAYPPALGAHQRARDAGWPMHELATGHDAMIIVPAGNSGPAGTSRQCEGLTMPHSEWNRLAFGLETAAQEIDGDKDDYNEKCKTYHLIIL